jgi:hypothetical protein
MGLNLDKPERWKADIAASVDLFNTWFLNFAPKAYRDTRIATTKDVEAALQLTNDLRSITPAVLSANPNVLPTLRMSTCPPLARDRLIGLSYTSKSLVGVMEEGKLPRRMPPAALETHLARIIDTLTKMLDVDIFPWLQKGGDTAPSEAERYRASTIVADRLCGAVSDPIVRNAQERRQLAYIGDYLTKKGYTQQAHPSGKPLTEMTPGTYYFRLCVVVGEPTLRINIPVDVVIQPKKPRPNQIPILVEAKSAGDFTNVNKRRKEEATKMHQLRSTFGKEVPFVLFLCGYFDSGYLGYEAAEGIDWVWEHRIEDMDQLGI